MKDDCTAEVQLDHHKKYIIQHIQAGNFYVTDVLVNYDVANFSLVDSGVLLVVLDFLKRCKYESFAKVSSSNNLKTPSKWIEILNRATRQEPSCMLQIAENIGPLVKCMCNDMERVFFKSNKHWREGVDAFVRLIYQIIYTCWDNSGDKMIVQTLLQKNEGLLTSIIQWGFWGEKNRPDIARELKKNAVDVCNVISVLGNVATVYLIVDEDNFLYDDGEFTEYGKEMLKLVGTTPVVSKDYDPNCQASYVVGLIQFMKTHDFEEIHFDALSSLIVDAGCVDKGVITEMIDWGLNYVADLNDAVEVARLSYDIMLKVNAISNTTRTANDTHTAFAIREGLIEMCLGFIESFWEHKSFGESELCIYISQVFISIHIVSLHQKTAKAIMSKRNGIEGRLACLEQNSNITNNSECEKVLDIIRLILLPM